MLFIPLNECKVFLNVPLFKQAQLCFFIHLYAQDWLVAHMLSQQNKAGQDGSHALSDSKINEEGISSSLVAPICSSDPVSIQIFYPSFSNFSHLYRYPWPLRLATLTGGT